MKNDSSGYDAKEVHLRLQHKEYRIPIPKCFENWALYFVSRGSALREWQRCMNEWIQDRNHIPQTDMTPSRQLEEKIRERREREGIQGPGFQTREVALTQPKPWEDRKRKEPAIAIPSGMTGQEHFVI